MIKDYLALCRISNLPTVWTNVLAALVLSGETAWANFFILSISMSLIYSGGMCLNDVCDADIDSLARVSRPIPSGRVSSGAAKRLTCFLFSLGILLLFIAPFKKGIIAGIVLLAAIAVYDRFHKKHPSSIFIMAFCRMMVYVSTSLAVAGFIAYPVMIAALSQFSYILVISAAARFENKRTVPYSFPLIPSMISNISTLDGIIMAIFSSPFWLIAGASGAFLTLLGQRYVRGD